MLLIAVGMIVVKVIKEPESEAERKEYELMVRYEGNKRFGLEAVVGALVFFFLILPLIAKCATNVADQIAGR